MEEGLHNPKVLLKAKLVCSLHRLHVGYFVYSLSLSYVHEEHCDMLEAGLGPYLDHLCHLFFHWIFISSTQRSWGAWHHHLSPSHQKAPAAVAGSWTCCLCNPEGRRQGLNGIFPTKLPAAFSTVSLNTLVQSCILFEIVWIDSGDFGMTQPLEMRLQQESETWIHTERLPPWDVLSPIQLPMMSHSALYLLVGAGP